MPIMLSLLILNIPTVYFFMPFVLWGALFLVFFFCTPYFFIGHSRSNVDYWLEDIDSYQIYQNMDQDDIQSMGLFCLAYSFIITSGITFFIISLMILLQYTGDLLSLISMIGLVILSYIWFGYIVFTMDVLIKILVRLNYIKFSNNDNQQTREWPPLTEEQIEQLTK